MNRWADGIGLHATTINTAQFLYTYEKKEKKMEEKSMHRVSIKRITSHAAWLGGGDSLAFDTPFSSSFHNIFMPCHEQEHTIRDHSAKYLERFQSRWGRVRSGFWVQYAHAHY